MSARRDRCELGRFDESGGWPLARTAGSAVASLSIFGALAVALLASSRRTPAPADWTHAEIEAWIERQPVSAAFCLVSTVALMVMLYLMVSTVALLMARAARAARRPRLERVAATIAAPAIRRSLAALLGIGLTVAVNGGPAHGDLRVAQTVSVTTDPSPTPSTATAEAPSGSATMRSLEPAEPAPAALSDPLPSSSAHDIWTIQPGDHLWGLADSALAAAWARDPNDAEVADYVHAIIDLNREVLVLPGHPDLIFPGQVFTRPAIQGRFLG